MIHTTKKSAPAERARRFRGAGLLSGLDLIRAALQAA